MQQIYTIGHSTRPIDDFISLLKTHSITQLVDIRTIPKSRHNPQFGREELEASLTKADIKYFYIEKLGGLRPKSEHSINDAWRNASFRNYADYMQTDEFTEGLEELIVITKKGVSAIMCAEAVPWRCHRSLVSDALLVRGFKVHEIISEKSTREHAMTQFAIVEGDKVTYPKSAVKDTS